MPTFTKNYKSPVIEPVSIYRTTPFQYINTAPYENSTHTVGELLNIKIPAIIIKLTKNQIVS